MLNEIKILFNNVRDFRKHLLSEGVSENRLANAINQHEIIHIYYAGDKTVMKGYRTIRPFVLGKYYRKKKKGSSDSNGQTVLRAWQDAGSSDSFKKQDGVKPRDGHERHTGPHGEKPGWRLFKVNSITSLMPTGRRFDPQKYFQVGSVTYKPNDGEMSGIVAAIQTGGGAFEKQTEPFQKFFNVAKKTRDITKEEVIELLKIARKYRKEAYRKFWVVELENGDMVLKTEPALAKAGVPIEDTLGNLKDLYNEFIVPEKRPSGEFFDRTKRKTQQEISQK